jgi:hypothetical protein
MSESISPRLEALLGRAVGRVHASEANEAISEMRVQLGTPEQPAFNYEIVLPTEDPLGHLAQLVPQLNYFLECSGRKPPDCDGMFISIFFGEELWFFRAQDVLEELSRLTAVRAFP